MVTSTIAQNVTGVECVLDLSVLRLLVSEIESIVYSVYNRTADIIDRLHDLLSSIFHCISSSAEYRVKVAVKHMNEIVI